jgi:hypothetical protein
MSLSQAIADIRRADSAAVHSRRRQFRARQHRLDDLIQEVEQLVMHEAVAIPGPMCWRAKQMLDRVNWIVPSWLDDHTTPRELLDRLFIAEGMLRRDHYRHNKGVEIELDDSA